MTGDFYMRKSALRVISALLLITIHHSLPAESGAPSTGGFVIRSEAYDISGRTRESVVRVFLGTAEGKTFGTKDALEAFAKARAQKLENLRVFKHSSVTVDYSAEDGSGTPVPVTLRTTIEDGAKFVPIPYAFYNSNDGFMAGMIANAPNLHGSLQNLTVVSLYSAPPDENDALRWADPNFLLLAALSGIRTSHAELGFTASAMRMNVTTENRGVDKAEFEELAGALSASVAVEIARSVKNAVKLRVGGSPAHTILSVSDPEYLSYGPIDFFAEAEDSVTRDTINWKGNFREGSKASVKAGYRYAIPTEADATKSLSCGAEIAQYRIAGTRLNPSFRVGAKGNTGDPDLKAGQVTRGIRNSGIKGNAAWYANATLQTKLFRAGHAEFHLAPVVDAIVAYVPDDPDYEWDWGVTAGGELLAFLDNAKSLPIKLGFAYDFRPDSRVNDKRYEVDFSFSLTY